MASMGLRNRKTRNGWWVALMLACTTLAAAATKRPSTAPVPEISIPVEPLGYRPPGQLYLVARTSSSSLNFLDSTHVLLTFRESRLLERDQHEPGHETGSDQSIRALVLELPGGNVTASADWRMHDRGRYLWPLQNGKVLVREMDRFFVTDASLELHPLLTSPTPLRETYVSPDGRMLVMESDQERHTPEEHARLLDRARTYGDDAIPEDVQIRMVRLDMKAMMLNAKADHPGKLIANANGFIDQAEVKQGEWLIRFHPFEKPEPTGGDVVAQFISTCAPEDNFLNETTLLTMSCPKGSSDRFAQAFALSGRQLWTGKWRSNFVWPTLASSEDGSTFAIAWVGVSHPMEAYDPVMDSDVGAQIVDVLDVKTGALRFNLEVRPILTAGGNFALSPDGNRLAVLNRGKLEVYAVPPAQAMPPPMTLLTIAGTSLIKQFTCGIGQSSVCGIDFVRRGVWIPLDTRAAGVRFWRRT